MRKIIITFEGETGSGKRLFPLILEDALKKDTRFNTDVKTVLENKEKTIIEINWEPK